MKEVLSTSDPVKLSFAQAVLKEAGIEAVLLDADTSALYGGGLSSIQPRLMVAENDAHQAKTALQAAFDDVRKNSGGAIKRPDTGLG